MKRKLLKRLYLWFWLFVASLNLLGQSWSIGRFSAFIHETSGPLTVTMHGASLAQMGFVSAVGGVAFRHTATPDSGFYVSHLSIDYDATREDGHRLKIVNGSDIVYPYLPDWELIPIANYSNSEYNSCVSLFGPKTDETKFDVVYHESFQNTLLGMRMLQADMVLMDTKSQWELPKYEGRTIIGKGETLPRSETSLAAAEKIHKLISSGGFFGSWVLTDDDVRLRFSIAADTIIFTGTPYYHFWATNIDQYRERMLKIYEKMIKEEGNNDLALHDDSLKFVTLYHRMQTEETKVIPVTSVTQKLKYKYSLLLELNPPVYHAVLNTVDYAGFFRYIKGNYPDVWHSFMSKIKYVKTQPAVSTPTTIPKPQDD